jgi:anti-anti-sigma factor
VPRRQTAPGTPYRPRILGSPLTVGDRGCHQAVVDEHDVENEATVTAANGLGGRFRVTVAFEEEQAVLGVRGEIDPSTAPALGAFFDAVIASGYLTISLDVAEIDNMDPAGLHVIMYAARRVAASGGRFTIRSPSSMVGRILALNGLADVIDSGQPDFASRHLGAEQVEIRPREQLITTPSGSTEQLRRVSALPAENDVIDGALRLVVALARATVGGADGVSVSLRRHGRLSTVAASDQTISNMDASQYATGEGPCVDASVEGRWFHAASLATETRWPDFTPRARALGINAILSSPLLASDRPVGALNIYSRTATAFAPRDQELASVFAGEASLILTKAGMDLTDDEVGARLGEAQQARRTIAQAEGIIMEREGIPADIAYTVLRSYSQRTNRPLHERAKEVVASTQRLTGDDPPGRTGLLDA